MASTNFVNRSSRVFSPMPSLLASRKYYTAELVSTVT